MMRDIVVAAGSSSNISGGGHSNNTTAAAVATATLTHARNITTTWKKTCSLPPAKKGILPLLPKKARYLSCQKWQPTPKRRSRKKQKKKKKQETEEEQNK